LERASVSVPVEPSRAAAIVPSEVPPEKGPIAGPTPGESNSSQPSPSLTGASADLKPTAPPAPMKASEEPRTPAAPALKDHRAYPKAAPRAVSQARRSMAGTAEVTPGHLACGSHITLAANSTNIFTNKAVRSYLKILSIEPGVSRLRITNGGDFVFFDSKPRKDRTIYLPPGDYTATVWSSNRSKRNDAIIGAIVMLPGLEDKLRAAVRKGRAHGRGGNSI
jgi:hypothetical protein